MTDETGIRYRVSDGVARITLDRPERSNAVDLPMVRSFDEAVRWAGSDAAVRVVLLAGEGARFCAGGDLTAMTEAADKSSYLHQLAGEFDSALQTLESLPKPVIAAVHGAAAGAGLALVLSADVIVSAKSTKYLTAYAGVGLTPDCGLSWLLPRAVGQQRALELALTGRILSADMACQWGLVSTVVEDEELGPSVDALARTLSAGVPNALGQTRRLIRSSWSVSRAESGADEARTISQAVTQAETQELIAKFVSVSSAR